MAFISQYVSHQVDANGFVNYNPEENRVWSLLFERQIKLLPHRACDDYLNGLSALNFSTQTIPQLPDVSRVLQAKTGWRVVPVAALISAREFFELLAQRCFPAATFIRHFEALDYVKEPDVFHELFGHCPMLMNPVFADFVYAYAQKVLTFPETDWPLLQRMFWFTVEFGLIKTASGLRVYGGGILSSIHETVYSVESDKPLHVLFNPTAVLRTPYRIDEPQSIYYVIDDFDALYRLTENMSIYIQRARELGEFAPLFETTNAEQQNIHIHAC